MPLSDQIQSFFIHFLAYFIKHSGGLFRCEVIQMQMNNQEKTDVVKHMPKFG